MAKTRNILTPRDLHVLATCRNVVESMPYTPSLGQALDKNEFFEVFAPSGAHLTISSLALLGEAQ